MNTDRTPTEQEIVAPDSAVLSEENVSPETAGEQRPKREVSPFSLVPALTLVALQFLQEEPSSLFDILFVNSAGKGGHRPAPQ